MSDWQSTYPPPPPHYKEAATLEPPPIPPDVENLLVFGRPLGQSFHRLQEQNEQKFGSISAASEGLTRKELLKRLNMSILFNFLEFVELLSENPSEWTKKFEDLKRLLFSMHSAINSYRPHQARTLIIAQLQQQISRRKDLLQLIEQKCEAAQKVLELARNKLHSTSSSSQQASQSDSQLSIGTT